MVQEMLVSTVSTEADNYQKQTMEKSPVFDILISSQLSLAEEKDSRLPSLLSELNMTRQKMSLCPFASILVKQNSSISDDRDCAVSSLRCMTLFYGSDTQTFATAVSFLDRFLSKVKVQHRYLSCVAAACYFLAAKINEEPEPSTLALCILQKAFSELELNSPVTHQLISWLHQICEVKDSEIYECHSNITCILSNFTNRPESHPSCLPIPKPQPRRSIISRPSYYGDSELPTIEEEESVTISIEMDKNSEDDNEEQYLYKDNRKSWSYCILPDRCLLPSETVFTFK
ncbi:hypothetical protein KUTeg_024333 [Tegillarca granosa]|uniref:Cyclin-like domain-containing protein n=1 Tax=Tegillarca granosa TaxID=220873 RepID=A0ABQ9DXR9_TEGGR|nr:hypothetical protein KUTeg_024333 [Tegillarca granosa]